MNHRQTTVLGVYTGRTMIFTIGGGFSRTPFFTPAGVNFVVQNVCTPCIREKLVVEPVMKLRVGS